MTDCLAYKATGMHAMFLRLKSGEIACAFCHKSTGEKTVPLPRVKGRRK